MHKQTIGVQGSKRKEVRKKKERKESKKEKRTTALSKERRISQSMVFVL